ncbi:hypothetical protein Nit79A3_1446 [Nitrosomonas sp. Is79A3]|uniref:hypothetical protein n=1 Tax=Nitrosomonas sp. (strain Is79A3) TaxID=261292 RepID=UPI000215D0C4
MIYFPVLRMRRLTVQLRELSIGESIKIASMPVHLEEATNTAMLRYAVESVKGKDIIEDPAHWTVQERIMTVCHYLASTSDGEPDFTIGKGRYTDYLDGSNDSGLIETHIKIGEVGGDIWHIRHLTGAMAESIERVSGEIPDISGKLHWLLGGMAAQMTIEGDNSPSPIDGEGNFDQFLVSRMKVIAGYPESDFEALLDLYLAGRRKLHHLFQIEFDENGIVSLPKGGAASDLPPARFPVSTCLSLITLNLVRVAHEPGI